MQTTLSWTKGIFQCTFQIQAGGYPVGKLKDSEFSRTAYGQLNNQEIAFRRCEGWQTKVEIIDLKSQQQIGKISFNPWYPKATITYGRQQAGWSFSNIWETRWKITNDQDEQINYRGWSGKGQVNISEQNDLLVLVGLYISSYYWRQAAVLVACILPVVLFPILF